MRMILAESVPAAALLEAQSYPEDEKASPETLVHALNLSCSCMPVVECESIFIAIGVAPSQRWELLLWHLWAARFNWFYLRHSLGGILIDP